jgi:hypothetical protein
MLALLVAGLAYAAPAPSVETVPAGEAAAIARVQEMIEDMVRDQARQDGHATRDAHAKAHGCAKATFEVLGGIRPDLAVGVFARPRQIKAWVRFSNGSGRSQNDAEGDGRGMAIKLLDVEGEKLMADERDAKTQDFVMINHPTFFVRDAATYVDFQRAVTSGNVLSFFFPGLNPLNWRNHELSQMRALLAREISTPLGTPYFSMTPYAHGDSKQIKYSVAPVVAVAAQPRIGTNFLGENLARQLRELGDDQTFQFDFRVQPRAGSGMPIEDPTVEWLESASAPITVARVTIRKQEIATAARREFCENLSMTPWHSLPEHRPLGGINRVRKVVYQRVSQLRHEINGVPRAEPAVATWDDARL